MYVLSSFCKNGEATKGLFGTAQLHSKAVFLENSFMSDFLDEVELF